MSYLAIARKYRPATFDEIVGQDHVTRTLKNAIARDRIHHAFLFCGARGVGKTTAARALAKSLNCVDGPTATPCGVCTSCVEISTGASPDLIEIDGASNNSVDDVRELRDTVQYAPSGGRSKIYLIDEVHMLSNAAFNALLKTLEEPPPRVVFIFATTEPSKIPDTILSRVQRFDFKRIPVPGVVERLAEIAATEGATISEASLRRIARAGEGSMRDAQSLLDKVISFAGPDIPDEVVDETLGLIDRGLLFGMLDGMITGEPVQCLTAIANVYEYGHEMAQFSSEMLELLRHAAFVRMSEEARTFVDLPDDEIERLLAITATTDVTVITRLFEAMMDVHEQVTRSSRPRIVLEMAVARLATIRPVLPVAQLIGRLEVLERRLRHQEAQGGGGGRSGREPRRSGPGRTQRAPSRTAGRARGHRSKSVGLPDDASDDDRWGAFQASVRAALSEAQALLSGHVRREGHRVVVTVDAGRTYAAAERLTQDPEVVFALRECYGPQALLIVEASLASRSDVPPELEQVVLADPACQRVLRMLGGTLSDVRIPDPGDAP